MSNHGAVSVQLRQGLKEVFGREPAQCSRETVGSFGSAWNYSWTVQLYFGSYTRRNSRLLNLRVYYAHGDAWAILRSLEDQGSTSSMRILTGDLVTILTSIKRELMAEVVDSALTGP